MPTSDHITHLKSLVQQEKEEDQRQYLEGLKSYSIPERRAKGICWHPLDIQETGYGLGDYPYIIVERTKGQGFPHRFNAGKTVSLFSSSAESEGEDLHGTVHFVDKDRMRVNFYVHELPDWLDLGKLGLNLHFDERSYREMERALDKLEKAKNDRLEELFDTITGKQKARFVPLSHRLEIPALNASQNKAVNQCLEAEDIAVVHGPPGTGKTTTLVETIKQLSKREKQILVCAPSNTATDLLTEKLADEGLNVIRIGNPAKVDEELISHTLEGQLANSPANKEVKKLKKQATEYRRMAGQYKRKFGKEEREQRRLLYREARAVAQQAIDLEDQFIDGALNNAQVVTATLVGSVSRYLVDREFQTVVIDESAQALEPATWIPITKANKVILAGDPFQLPPTVKNPKAQKDGLEITLMERIIKQQRQDDCTTLLDTQYRMNKDIMGYSNQVFYDNQLKADASVQDILLDDSQTALEFIDTAGCGFEEVEGQEAKSLSNPEEANILFKHFELLKPFCNGHSVGIISPYKAQVIGLKELFKEENVDVNTVDSFQGQERDVIYISMVRSNEDCIIGFLSDYRRMNVAMTRAKKKLVIIGDSATLGSHSFYADFLAYCEEKNAYRSAWEFMA